MGRRFLVLCTAKIKNAQIGLRGDYFQRIGIGLRASRRAAMTKKQYNTPNVCVGTVKIALGKKTWKRGNRR